MDRLLTLLSFCRYVLLPMMALFCFIPHAVHSQQKSGVSISGLNFSCDDSELRYIDASQATLGEVKIADGKVRLIQMVL